MKKQQLASLVKFVRVGITLRDALNIQDNGDCLAVLPKNVVTGDAPGAASVCKGDFRAEQFLQAGDVLVTNRGQIKALVFDGVKPAVACGALFVVRVDSRRMLPDFFAMLINFGIVQREYTRCQETMTVPAITRLQFLNMAVPVVSLEKQKKILKLTETYALESKLIAQITELKDNMIKAIIKGELDG